MARVHAVVALVALIVALTGGSAEAARRSPVEPAARKARPPGVAAGAARALRPLVKVSGAQAAPLVSTSTLELSGVVHSNTSKACARQIKATGEGSLLRLPKPGAARSWELVGPCRRASDRRARRPAPAPAGCDGGHRPPHTHVHRRPCPGAGAGPGHGGSRYGEGLAALARGRAYASSVLLRCLAVESACDCPRAHATECNSFLSTISYTRGPLPLRAVGTGYGGGARGVNGAACPYAYGRRPHRRSSDTGADAQGGRKGCEGGSRARCRTGDGGERCRLDEPLVHGRRGSCTAHRERRSARHEPGVFRGLLPADSGLRTRASGRRRCHEPAG